MHLAVHGTRHMHGTLVTAVQSTVGAVQALEPPTPQLLVAGPAAPTALTRRRELVDRGALLALGHAAVAVAGALVAPAHEGNHLGCRNGGSLWMGREYGQVQQGMVMDRGNLSVSCQPMQQHWKPPTTATRAAQAPTLTRFSSALLASSSRRAITDARVRANTMPCQPLPPLPPLPPLLPPLPANSSLSSK